jgi:hypothetical protein
MKKITVSVSLLFACYFVLAQVSFQKQYAGTLSTISSSIIQTADGGYLIAGSTDNTPAGNGDIFLIKTDAFGDTLWTKIYDKLNSDDLANSVKQTPDGGYIIVSYIGNPGDSLLGRILLIRTDSNGDSLWTKSFATAGGESASAVNLTNDGGFVITGKSQEAGGPGKMLLLKSDSTGNLLWCKSYEGSDYESGNSVIQTSDSGYIIGGGAYNISGFSGVCMVKTDSIGSPLWSKMFAVSIGSIAYSLQQTSDGGFIMAGYAQISVNPSVHGAYLLRTDGAGNLIWSKIFGAAPNCMGRSARQTSDGGFILTGFRMGAGLDTYLLKTDSIGIPVWAKTYGSTGIEEAYEVLNTTDGGYILTGATANGPWGSGIYVVKTDSLGNTGCSFEAPGDTSQTPHITITINLPTVVTSGGTTTAYPIVMRGGGSVYSICPVGINEELHIRNDIITLYPNPATNELVVNSSELGNNAELSIYNVFGELIFKQQTTNADASVSTFGNKLQTVDISQLPSGIYFVRLKTEEGIRVAKFVKE